MKSSYVGFLVFVCLLVIFFVIPDPEGLQKPFRILLAAAFVVIYTAKLIKKDISYKSLIPAVGTACLLIIMINRGTLQTSYFNAALCLFGILCLPSIKFELTEIRRTNLIYVHTLCLISIIVQFLIFSSKDGRPALAYEINLSAAYLFLFFLFSDVLNLKYGKIIVIFLSLLTLSRLLIFSVALFYLVKYIKPYFRVLLAKVSVLLILIASYALISVFSIWYVAHVKYEIAYDTSVNRLTRLNDGSNALRFFSNTLVLGAIYQSPLDPKILYGYGKVENFIKATKDSLIMPHNELFDSIVQFGIISVIFFSIFTISVYQKYTNFSNIEFFIPVLLYTLILWVRFLLIPSFEMIFILFLMYMVNQKRQKIEAQGLNI
jgi:hypothetical protein